MIAGTAGYLLINSVLMVACDGAAPQRITAPTAPTATFPPPVFGGTLSGVVFETIAGARVPLAGVKVYCDACGPPLGHQLTETDSNGVYVLNGALAGDNRLLLSKPGFKLPQPVWVSATDIGWMGGIDVMVNGDTRYDIEIVRQ